MALETGSLTSGVASPLSLSPPTLLLPLSLLPLLFCQSWRLKDGDIPTLLLDLGVHVHHLCDFLVGQKALKVHGDFNNFSIFKSIIDDAHFWVEFAEEFKGNFG